LGSNGLTYINPGFTERSVEIEILNSPFVSRFYEEGKINIHGKPGLVAKMRYNAAKDVIEFKDENETVKELLRRPYISAEFDGKEYIVLNYVVEYTNINKLGYFNPLNEGKIQLLYMPKKSLEVSGYSIQERRSGKYSDVSSYYIKIGDGPAREVKLNKRSILKIIGERNLNLEQVIKNQNLNLKKVEDIIHLIDYYNTVDKKARISQQDS